MSVEKGNWIAVFVLVSELVGGYFWGMGLYISKALWYIS